VTDIDDGVPAWWDRLDGDQRSTVEHAAQSRTLDEKGRRVLTDTGCPMPPTALKYDDTEGWVWQEPLREYVLLQAQFDL